MRYASRLSATIPGNGGSYREVKSIATFLTESDIVQVTGLDPYLTGVVDLLESGFKDYVRGQIVTPVEERLRLVYPPGQEKRPYDKDMRILPAMVPSLNAAGVHIGCNSKVDEGFTSYMILMDFQRLAPLAIMEDRFLHSIRAGAPTGLAARHLARPDASVLGVIGSGRIARVQVAACCGQRPIKAVKVYSPNPVHREAFAQEASTRFGIHAEPVESARQAVEGADIVTVATNSYREPVMDGSWLSPGALVASVTPGEMDVRTARRSRIVVTSRNRILRDYTPWEPLASLVRSGELDLEAIPSLGEVLVGLASGRETPEQIIYFASPGIGFCDVVVARWAYDLATKAGLGRTL